MDNSMDPGDIFLLALCSCGTHSAKFNVMEKSIQDGGRSNLAKVYEYEAYCPGCMYRTGYFSHPQTATDEWNERQKIKEAENGCRKSKVL